MTELYQSKETRLHMIRLARDKKLIPTFWLIPIQLAKMAKKLNIYQLILTLYPCFLTFCSRAQSISLPFYLLIGEYYGRNTHV